MENEENDDTDDRPVKVFCTRVNYMSAEAADLSGEQFIAVSFEDDPRKISVICFSHEDAHQLLGGLIESLSSLGCDVAQKLLGALNDIASQDEEAEESEDENVEADEEEEVQDASSDHTYPEAEPIDGDTDDYGPDQ